MWVGTLELSHKMSGIWKFAPYYFTVACWGAVLPTGPFGLILGHLPKSRFSIPLTLSSLKEGMLKLGFPDDNCLAADCHVVSTERLQNGFGLYWAIPNGAIWGFSFSR